jgi:glycosyltransferase involved in cell wall biosynthesis
MIVTALLKAGASVKVIFGHEGEMLADYQQAGCECHVVPHGSWLRHGTLFRSIRRMQKERQAARDIADIIQTCSPDLVYVNSLVSYAAALAGHKCRLPVVWHVRELFNDVGGEACIPRLGGRSFVRRQLCQLTTAVVAISNVVASNVLGPKVMSRTTIIPNAVSETFAAGLIDRKAARSQFGFDDGSFVVGAIGSLRPVKGFDILVKAVALTAGDIPNLQVAIAGTGDSSELRSLAESLNIQDHIRFLGGVQPIRPFYDACDIICVPSRSESFGRVATEAMCSGRPVVATSVGGMLETIVDHETGILVEPDSPQSIANAIQLLAKDAGLRDRIQTAGPKRYSDYYSAETMKTRLLDLVCRVVQASNAHSPPNATHSG